VLFSTDGAVRVQLGSLSQTTRNLLREGIQGEQVFILPADLFAGRTNYGDIEFLVYLNFFARGRFRTRIVGTARQRETLWRLLTLTVFGLFDPALSEQPGFEALQHDHGIPDREAYDFFRMAFETFAVRAGPAPESPLLRIEDYIDYTVLTQAETRVPIGSKGDRGEVRIRPRGRSFEVRIEDADGQVRAKTLELSVPHRFGVQVPDEAREPLQFATDRPRFGVSSLGTSHGFDPAGDLTSLVIWVNGKGILVDPSPEAVAYLERLGVASVDVPYVFLTHVHADHDGGLIEKLLGGSRTTVIASTVVFRAFAEKTRLITGHDLEREGFVSHVAVEPGHPVTLELAGELATLETRWNLHPIPTNGLRVSVGGRTFGYSADTKYDPAWLTALRARGALTARQYDHLMSFFWTPEGTPTVDLLYHEAGVPPIHTERAQLEALPDRVKARTRLVHVADRDVPAGAVPGKPRLFETHVLLPPIPESRARILLETLRLVGYLYDTPLPVLEELLQGADVVDWKRDEVIIRKGAVDSGEPLHFFVIADGEVAVRDGRRLLARLVKADSFGEWGISHQRGFRMADVVATHPCRCLRFTEAQYWWLIERQPVVQERISRIRSLVPRLEVAQQRARYQEDRTLAEGRRLLAPLTANQLTGFALFSELQTFRQGEPILIEGGPADGFYVLLSGHLQATVAGQPVGELSEGDGFGEMGLLTGGTRAATITVVSADADVLFMSAQGFRAMLEGVPAFAWDVWATVASRRQGGPSGARREEPA
jgi:CRP-like cAMP-binding protein